MGDSLKPVVASDRVVSRIAICSAYANDSVGINRCFDFLDNFQERPAEQLGLQGEVKCSVQSQAVEDAKYGAPWYHFQAICEGRPLNGAKVPAGGWNRSLITRHGEKSGSPSAFFQLYGCVTLREPVPGNSAFFGYGCSVSKCEEEAEAGGPVGCEPLKGVIAEAVIMKDRKMGGRSSPQWLSLKAEGDVALPAGWRDARFAESWYQEVLAKTYLGASEIPWYDQRTLGALPCRILWGDQAIIRE